MKLFLTIALFTAFLVSGCSHSSDPSEARLVTEDIDRFWIAYDAFTVSLDPADLQTLYLDQGTVGLRGFINGRLSSAEKLAEAIENHRDYYDSIRTPLGDIVNREREIRTAFNRLKELYPAAVYPDVYFVIGRMNAGGTTSRHGLIIGAEMYGLTPETPLSGLSKWHQEVLKTASALPHIVSHELIHFQQPFSLKAKLFPSLLYESLREGSADFVGELISGHHINEAVHSYANPRELALWNEFQLAMHEDDLSEWIANGSTSTHRPADLGYWMGYKIVEWYYVNSSDKKAALNDIINMKSATALLEKSGYAEKPKS